MSTLLAQLNFEKRKIKSLLSYFRGSVVLHTPEHSRTDQMHFIPLCNTMNLNFAQEMQMRV
jgi:hypothetical protein